LETEFFKEIFFVKKKIIFCFAKIYNENILSMEEISFLNRSLVLSQNKINFTSLKKLKEKINFAYYTAIFKEKLLMEKNL